MYEEYLRFASPGALKKAHKKLVAMVGDQRTATSHHAFEKTLAGLDANEVCLSVGGGPNRVHPRLINLNLAPFKNVDIVATAYALPYAEGAVAAVHCEAVLEHLEFPDAAVAEMHRVLRIGGLVYSNTPFLQAYHGYPAHYQNFTLAGHRRLFERAGFVVLEAGVSVGPTFMLSDLVTNYVRHALPGGALGRWLARLAEIWFLPLRLLDRIASRRPSAHTICSTTFVLAQKHPHNARCSSLTGAA